MNEELEKRLTELEKRIAALESRPKAEPKWVHIGRIGGYSKNDGKRVSSDYALYCSTDNNLGRTFYRIKNDWPGTIYVVTRFDEEREFKADNGVLVRCNAECSFLFLNI